jgi:hypothetical protein
VKRKKRAVEEGAKGRIKREQRKMMKAGQKES